MTPELDLGLLKLGLTRRDFAAIVDVHEDVVSAWGRGVRPEPLWARHLIHAWLADKTLLKDALTGAQVQIDRAMNKPLDPNKYPPDETPEQVALRVARDQVKFGVAPGERDLRHLLDDKAS